MMMEFKKLYANTLKPFVGTNISKSVANKLYILIKESATETDKTKNILIDNKKPAHNVKFLGSQGGVKTYQNELTNTITMTGIANNKVLKVGEKVRDKFGKLVVILETEDENEDNINQKVKYKSPSGAIVSSLKWQLLGL